MYFPAHLQLIKVPLWNHAAITSLEIQLGQLFQMSIVLFPSYVRGADGEWGWRWEKKSKRKHQMQVGEKSGRWERVKPQNEGEVCKCYCMQIEEHGRKRREGGCDVRGGSAWKQSRERRLKVQSYVETKVKWNETNTKLKHWRWGTSFHSISGLKHWQKTPHDDVTRENKVDILL